MKAVIIAGGLGTRLRPLTYHMPKPVVPVANQPFTLHQIELLRQHGITEIILSIHYLSEEIKRILGDGSNFGVKIYYSIEEHALGTAGAVKNAEEYFDDDPMVVFNGDVLTDINLSQIIEYHREKKAKATLTLKRVEDPTAYGLILTDEEGRIEHFIEKPSWEIVSNYSEKCQANTINAGIYILDPKVFAEVPKGVEFSFERQLFPSLLERKEPLYGYVSDRYWIDIGSPAQYRQAHEDILRGEVAVKIAGARVDGKVWIAEGAQIDDKAKLLGPAIIGKNVEIGAGARIKDFTVLGEGVSVGADTALDKTIVWSGTKIGRHVTLSGCIIAADCVIEDNVSLRGEVVLAGGSIIKKGSILLS